MTEGVTGYEHTRISVLYYVERVGSVTFSQGEPDMPNEGYEDDNEVLELYMGVRCRNPHCEHELFYEDYRDAPLPLLALFYVRLLRGCSSPKKATPIAYKQKAACSNNAWRHSPVWPGFSETRPIFITNGGLFR